jgi:chromosome segregation ATPase
MGDAQLTQLERTLEVAQDRLRDMEQQRDELNVAIEELKEQMGWGEQMITSLKQDKKAAE